MCALINLFLVILLTTITIGQNLNEPCNILESNVAGICKFPKDCPAVEASAKQGVRGQLCGFHVNILPIFCCTDPGGEKPPPAVQPAPQPPPQPPQPPQLPPNTLTPAPVVNETFAINYLETMCMEYTKNVSQIQSHGNLGVNSPSVTNIISMCDKDSVSLIINGNKTALKEFPFMAALGFKNGDEITWQCGGSLISKWFVLTAAHCLIKVPQINLVRLGDYNLANNTDGSEHKDYLFNSSSVFRHEGYQRPPVYHDIALIKLNEEVIFTDFIKPTCLWTKPTKIIKNTTLAIGWGATDFDAFEQSNDLLKVSLKVYDNSVCNNTFSGDIDKFPQGVQPTMLCSGDTTGSSDTCSGDSGGPLLKTDDDNACIQYIVGITSTGIRCGQNLPAIYTRVSSYLGWIVHTMINN